MRQVQMVFSPTGGTQRVSERLCEGLGGAWEMVDLTEEVQPAAFAPEDLCVVAVPAYGGRVPAPAIERLRRMQGGGARAILVAVYGNRAIDDTLIELEDALLAAGFRCAGAVSAVAEHSIVRQYGAGRPDAQDADCLRAFGARIREALSNGAGETPVQVPGNRPYRAFGGIPFKPQANARCTKCGLCAARCPAGAIPKENPASVRPELCISCMRCIAICPEGARPMSQALVQGTAEKLRAVCAERKENELFL